MPKNTVSRGCLAFRVGFEYFESGFPCQGCKLMSVKTRMFRICRKKSQCFFDGFEALFLAMVLFERLQLGVCLY